ncbi:histone-like protein [Bacillus phage Chedec 11]|uniref:Histone-like protein n=1 Tax=Bacillus phage Chedec 11 TaxID=2932672 RepID=A0A976MZZ4_9CAUD|nr:histone-like protein [Bacillus phage Chedec 11]
MRKMVQREITHTKVNLARMVLKDGEVSAELLEPVTLVGNLSVEQAQREINKREEFKEQAAQVIGVEPNTQLYELPLDVFLELGTVKEDRNHKHKDEETVQEVEA